MEPIIKNIDKKILIGKRMWMSFDDDKTIELWKSFAQVKNNIKDSINSNLYSVEIYNDPKFYVDFNPSKKFEKWAAIEVRNIDFIPEDMESLVIPEGKYAVFHYKGKPSEAQETFHYIYGVWLPDSAYEMDNRPYIAMMAEKYKGEDPDSEEEFWIPIRSK